MTHEDMIIKRVAEMDEDLAKEVLAQIFLEISGTGSASDEAVAYKEIARLYRRHITIAAVRESRK